jgi:precorrin-6A/cobalt-precorrin-6A reductase
VTILILGGTAEARALAAELVERGQPVLSSLAGRVSAPALPAGEVRIGGFGGVEGLRAYLVARRIPTVVDATHPFAATMSRHAQAATSVAGCRLLRLQRPGWADHPDADRWTWVDGPAAALRAGAAARRPFLTTGRQSLEQFLPWADRRVLVRVVEAPTFAVPEPWGLIRSRGPYQRPAERRLMQQEAVDLLVTKDSGGAFTEAKLGAAADLGVPVVVLSRPEPPVGVPTVSTVAGALDWLAVAPGAR